VDNTSESPLSRHTFLALTDFAQEASEIRARFTTRPTRASVDDEDLLYYLVPRVSDPSLWSVCVKVQFSACFHFTASDVFKLGYCYGRSTIVSDVDVEGFVLNVDGGSVQELDYDKVCTTERWINTQGCHGRIVLFGFLS
jgi:hypothetical protein